MNLLENYTNLVEKVKALDRKTLESLKFFFMFIIVADLFGIYWFLDLKKLGGAIMAVMIVALAIILILERRLPPLPKQTIKKEVKKMEEKQEQQVKEQPQEDLTGLSQFTEGYQERAEKALGTF